MEVSLSSVFEALPEVEANCQRQTFRFFDLPFELRSKILSYLLILDRVVDLDPDNYRAAHHRLHIFLVSQRLYTEASQIFYSSHTFRIFPTHGRFFTHKTKPLLSRLHKSYRADLTSLELRLGPGWSNPPKSWRVTDTLGLEEMMAVRKLKVFVECDPSHDIFRGFRIGKDFFTDFAAELLESIIKRLPALGRVEYDGWPSVMKEGPLVRRLVAVARQLGKKTVRLGTLREQEDEMCITESMSEHSIIVISAKNA
jgi:hypothetical protein